MAESGERNLVAALTAALDSITKNNSAATAISSGQMTASLPQGQVYSTENGTGWHNDQRHYPNHFNGTFQNHAASPPWGPVEQTKNPRTGNDWVSRIPVPPPPPFSSGYSQGFSRIPVPPPPFSSGHSQGYQQSCNGQGKVSCGNIPVRLYSGRLVSYDAEKGFGSIGCEEIQVTTGQNVKVHYGLLEHSGTGLGDTIVFTVAYPESGVLQAVKPALRIACANAFALAGVFHAWDDASEEFGYIDCRETKAAFGCNVCVSMEVAAWFSSGQRVVFNAMLEKDSVLRVTIAEVATKYNIPVPGHYNLTKSGQVVDAGNVFPQSTCSSAINTFGENGQHEQTNMDLANDAFVQAEACLSHKAFAAAGTWITAAIAAARSKPSLDTRLPSPK